MRWAEYVARMGDKRGAYRDLVGRPEGKSLLGIPRRRWKNNIKINFQEKGRRNMSGFDLAHNREKWRALVRAVMNLRVP
jgi:hypothetical protein